MDKSHSPQERVIKQRKRALKSVINTLEGTRKLDKTNTSEREKPDMPELPHSTIEDKIFNPDDIRFMLKLRSSMHANPSHVSRTAHN